jgi:NAD(P)-dependent dehydrogenase (short-subunit alcohol dehydrogenase family)
MTSGTSPVPEPRQPELLGQRVVVIGGTGGIGLETARRARAEGADVILTGRDPDRLEQAARELGAPQPSTPTIRLPCRGSFRICRHRSTM